MEQLDGYDLKLLAELQRDGRLTNNELSERVALSPSQCSRRRMRLEAEGLITGYHAALDGAKLGLELLVAKLVCDLPEVLEAYALTGEMDYHLKVVTPGLASLAHFVNEVLLPHESVQHVRTAIVLDRLKNFGGLPIPGRALA